jgi:hypothetical protein
MSLPSTHRATRLLAIGLGFVALTAYAALSPTGADAAMRTHSMYDKRYCEYLFVHAGNSGLYADVWNTFGLNSCPATKWKASNPPALSAEMGALVTKLNGPRHWLIDRAQITFDTSTDPPQGSVRSFAGLKMRLLTTVDVPVVNGAPGMPSYTETIVNRKTHFTFSRRKPLRMLVAPDGKRYAMQAYSQIKDPTLRESQINGLGRRLDLPAGWSFKVRKLRKDLTLRTSGRTTVVQDELENTYQLIR